MIARTVPTFPLLPMLCLGLLTTTTAGCVEAHAGKERREPEGSTQYEVNIRALCDGTRVGTGDDGFDIYCAPAGTRWQVVKATCEEVWRRESGKWCGSHSVTCTVRREVATRKHPCSCTNDKGESDSSVKICASTW